MKKKIPIRNYIILAIIALFTIIITLYVSSLIKAYKIDKLRVSPLSGEVQEITLDELNIVTSEMTDVILYLGYTNDSKVYSSEKRILKYLNSHDLSNKFVYIDVSKYLEKDKYIDVLAETFQNKKDSLKTAPMLIYIKNGEAIEVINNFTFSKEKQILSSLIFS